MKAKHLIFAFIYAAVCLGNLLALPLKESQLGILLSTAFIIGFAAGSAYHLHLYVTKAR